VTTAAPTVTPDIDESTTVDQPWVVIVWDDPVNLMDYVVFVFRDVLGVPTDEATRLMLQVHTEGKAAVFEGTRERAEMLVLQLQAHGLWASMEQ
jgi:ATP-dependent Clp protease adaptor protein ClpS